MANTTSAKKMVRKIARRTEVNKSRRTILRTEIRRVEEAISSGNQEAAKNAMRAAEPILMRTAQQGVIHKNAASRKVSRLVQRIRSMSE